MPSRPSNRILNDFGISYRLCRYNISRDVIPELAKAAVGPVRLTINNPRRVSGKDDVDLLEANY